MDIARINNRSNFIFRDYPNYHPESLKYLEFWSKVKKRVIEGYWGQDTKDTNEKGMWRFMPPQLYFYANLGHILHKKKGASKTAPRTIVYPNLDDIDWDFSYKWLEARGFSGFKDDEEFTCSREVDLYNRGKIPIDDVPQSAFNRKGELKEYVPARKYINKLFDKPLGLPLYDNEARNLVMLGSRGSGKDLEENTLIHSVSRGAIPIKDVELGEYIWGDDGKPTKVVDKKYFNDQVQYKIKLKDVKTPIYSGEGHIWRIKTIAGEFNRELSVFKDYPEHILLPYKKDIFSDTLWSIVEYIKATEIKPSVCIGVDNDSHLFLAGEYMVTHNSYWGANICTLHEIITDGAKEYTEESIKNPGKVELFVGAAMASKSADLLEKVLMTLNNLPGVWKPGTEEEIPSPLYKRTTGSLLQPSKIPWTCKYQKKLGGEWKWLGSHSSIKHGTWTIENPEAAAGGRYSVVVAEEFGLMPNSIQVHLSNIPTMYIEHKLGSALYLGTGGNIEKVQQSQIIFSEPASYESLEFDDIWENTGKIGYFIPATYADRKFKDEEGNTKIEEATAYYQAKRDKAKLAKSGSALEMEMMNYPLVPSEMFLNKSRNNYPTVDLKHRLSELMTNDKLLNSTYKGGFIITEEGEVKWQNKDVFPIREYPLRNENMEGCGEMFYMPQRDGEDRIPYGRYIAALDPIDDDDNEDNSLSLQSFFIYDLWTEKIVFEYSGRTFLAKDFYEQCRRALIYYNARMLYENQKKGVFTYFDQKNSLYLLEDTPPELRDMDMQKGSTVGNKSKGIYATPAINKWGREQLGPSWMSSQAVSKPEGVTNANTLLSVGLIKEALLYNADVNADRISAFGILMIFREVRIKYKPKQEEEKKSSYMNDSFFKRTYGDNSYNKLKFPVKT